MSKGSSKLVNYIKYFFFDYDDLEEEVAAKPPLVVIKNKLESTTQPQNPCEAKMVIVKPTSFEDVQEICDKHKSGCSVLVNLEDTDIVSKERIKVFLKGYCYAMDIKLKTVDATVLVVEG